MDQILTLIKPSKVDHRLFARDDLMGALALQSMAKDEDSHVLYLHACIKVQEARAKFWDMIQ